MTQNQQLNLLIKASVALGGIEKAVEYILAMLFLKNLSDYLGERYEKYKEQFGGEETRIQRRMERERFILPKGCGFYDLYKQRNESTLGEILNRTFELLEEANKKKLGGVFQEMDFNSESWLGMTGDRNQALKKMLDELQQIRFIGEEKSSITKNLSSDLLHHFAVQSGKKLGEALTPPWVVDLVTEIASPQPGEQIMDPACGTGSLLIGCSQSLLNQGSGNFSLFGQEVNRRIWTLNRLNMLLHELDHARIEWADTLHDPRLTEGKTLMQFDLVVSTIPFSLEKWGYEEANRDPFNRYHRGLPPKTKGDFAFLSHIAESLKPEQGRAVVVTSYGVLFRGAYEAQIRQVLVEENLLDTVVGLPDMLFPGTGIKTAILVFSKEKKDNKVLFINAMEEFQKGKKKLNRLGSEQIEKIVSTYRNREVKEKYSTLAGLEEIRENEFNLNITRYVSQLEEKKDIDLPLWQQEIRTQEKELLLVQKKLSDSLKEFGFYPLFSD